MSRDEAGLHVDVQKVLFSRARLEDGAGLTRTRARCFGNVFPLPGLYCCP